MNFEVKENEIKAKINELNEERKNAIEYIKKVETELTLLSGEMRLIQEIKESKKDGE